jgi:hypothetical protein
MCTRAKISYVPALSEVYGDIEGFGKEYMKFVQLCAISRSFYFMAAPCHGIIYPATAGFSALHV